jgi:hypothetical protein
LGKSESPSQCLLAEFSSRFRPGDYRMRTMTVVPRIADVQCSRLVFQPGDRILVKTNYRLDPEARRKLTAGIRKWAGCEVEVLIYSKLDMEISIEKRENSLLLPGGISE